jgi:hypothetical protein
MREQTYEITAESLSEARNQAKARIPPGYYLLSEQILSEDKTEIVKETSEKTEDAFATAKTKLPLGVVIISEKLVQAPGVYAMQLPGIDENAARKQAESKIDNTCDIKTISLKTPGSKGFLGIGKTLNQYEIQISKKAVAEITYKTNSTIKITITDQISNWQTFLPILKELKDPLLATELQSQFPYQTLFALVKGNLDDVGFYKEVPFAPIKKESIEKARKYVDQPPIPMLLAAFGAGLSQDRYVIMANGEIGRKSNSEIDGLIVSVAQCLTGRGVIRDQSGIANAAYDAIIHYQKIPAVYYFFVLPYLDSVISTKKLSKEEALITAYKGVEGLILQLYDELGEGQVISDGMVKKRVLEMLN